jgi:hypothetical protein
MAEDLKITEEDLATLLRSKVNQVTNLELQMATLTRALSERNAEIAELKGEADAESG